MATEVKLPSLGEGVPSGDVLEIFVKEGDVVTKDQGLLELETDKATVTVPSPSAGKIVKLLIQEGATVAVGAPIFLMETVGAACTCPAPATPPAAKVPEIPVAAEVAPPPVKIPAASIAPVPQVKPVEPPPVLQPVVPVATLPPTPAAPVVAEVGPPEMSFRRDLPFVDLRAKSAWSSVVS